MVKMLKETRVNTLANAPHRTEELEEVELIASNTESDKNKFKHVMDR